MHLLLRHAQRDDGWIWSSMTFLLDARLDLDPDEQHLFEKYRLYDRVVYNSDAFLQHLHAADEYREAAAAPLTALPFDASIDQHIAALAATAYNSFAALSHNVLGRLSLQITLQTLVDGQRFESQDLEELLTVAQLIQQAADFLATYLNVALTFDGREELSEH